MTQSKMESTTVSADLGILLLALELSDKKWVLAFGARVGGKVRLKAIAADLGLLFREIELAKKALGLGADAPVKACYEAGREGFWLCRALKARGVECLVIDSASIEVDRRRKQRKTDRIDAKKLLERLMREHVGVSTEHWRVVRVPPAQVEDARHEDRERSELKKEQRRLRNQISSLVHLHGIRAPIRNEAALDAVRDWSGEPLEPVLKARLKRMLERLRLLAEQIAALEEERSESMSANTPEARKMRSLQQLRGIGTVSSMALIREIGWRDFRNRREIAGACGLGSCPYSSGNIERDQGISKAGNKRMRTLMVQLAWGWLRFQPSSELTRWFWKKCGKDKKLKRVAIVALARKLLIALWRFWDQGVVIEGARLKTA